MAQIVFDCFPGGRRKALVMSYDDGQIHDRRLVEIFNRYGIRGTFCLNSGRLDRDGYLSSGEIASLFAGHEVAVHTVTHPCLTHLPRERVIAEVMDDRRALEKLVGYPVRGMSYPGGDYNAAVTDLLPSLGIAYSRTVESPPSFTPPDDFMRWPISCHHGSCIEKGKAFLQVPPKWGRQVFLVFGHSYEFPKANNWVLIEEFCVLLGRNPAIWYATHIEVADYLKALEQVRSSVDGTILTNPTGAEIWYSDWSRQGDVFGSIKPGQTVRL